MKNLFLLMMSILAISSHASPSSEGLEKISREVSDSIAANKSESPYRTLPSEVYEDPSFQKDLIAAFEEIAPDEWKAAARSGGNMHNPKMFPLRNHLQAAFLKTEFCRMLDRDLARHGMKVTSLTAEKLSYDMVNDRRLLRAIFFVKAGPVHNQQDSSKTDPPASPTLAFAKKLIVPRALFEATPLSEAVDYLRSMSRTGMAIDGAPAPFKLNFVVQDPDKRAKPVDLDVKSIPLDKLCEKVAAAAGMLVRFEDEAVVFSPIPTVERHQDGKTPGEEHDES